MTKETKVEKPTAAQLVKAAKTALREGGRAVDAYIDGRILVDKENTLIRRLKTTFDALIDQPRNNTQQHVTALIANATAWLALPTDLVPDKEGAGKLCGVLQNTVKTLQSALSDQTISRVARFKINVNKINGELAMLLAALEAKSNELKQAAASTETSSVDVAADGAQPVVTKGLQAHLNEQFTQTQEADSTQVEKLTALKAKLSTVNDDLSLLIEKRQEQEALRLQHQTVSPSSSSPESPVDNKASRSPVMSLTTYFKEFKKKLGFSKKAPNIEPPSTVDTLLRTDVNDSAQQQTETIKALNEKISNGNTALATCLRDVSIEELEQVRETNTALYAVVDEGLRFMECAEKTAHIKALDRFIEKHDNWKVKLSNFLANFLHPIFKTNTATQVDEARRFQRDLSQVRQEAEAVLDKYHAENASRLEELGVTPLLPPEVLVDTVKKFTSIKEKYREMKPQADAPAPAQEPGSDSPGGRRLL